MKIKAHSFLILNRKYIDLENILPMNSTKPIFVKILATKKNGKSDGNIFSFHKLKLKRIEPFILLILKKIFIILK